MRACSRYIDLHGLLNLCISNAHNNIQIKTKLKPPAGRYNAPPSGWTTAATLACMIPNVSLMDWIGNKTKWRKAIHGRAAHHEKDLHRATEDKRQQRKERLNINHYQPLPPHTLGSLVGFVGHTSASSVIWRATNMSHQEDNHRVLDPEWLLMIMMLTFSLLNWGQKAAGGKGRVCRCQRSAAHLAVGRRDIGESGS